MPVVVSCVANWPLRVSGYGILGEFKVKLREDATVVLNEENDSLVWGEADTEVSARGCSDGWLPEIILDI